MDARAVVLDMDGSLAERRPLAAVIQPGGGQEMDGWLAESVAEWAAEAEALVIVDLSRLPAWERREYSICFAEAWTRAGGAAELLVHDLDGPVSASIQAAPRPEGSRLWPAIAVAVAAAATLPVATVVVGAAVAGAGLGLWLGLGATRAR